MADSSRTVSKKKKAVDRCHRIGFCHEALEVYRLIAANTIEEDIVDLQNKKRVLIEQGTRTEGKVDKELDLKHMVSSLFDRKIKLCTQFRSSTEKRPWLFVDRAGDKRPEKRPEKRAKRDA